MGRVSDLHDDLTVIGELLAAHIEQAQANARSAERCEDTLTKVVWLTRVDALQDLALEIEAQGIEFPDGSPQVSPNQRGFY